jgi:hypothetical protein
MNAQLSTPTQHIPTTIQEPAFVTFSVLCHGPLAVILIFIILVVLTTEAVGLLLCQDEMVGNYNDPSFFWDQLLTEESGKFVSLSGTHWGAGD